MPLSSFNSAQFNRTFGQFNEPDYAGNYILNKKAKTMYCAANNCIPSVKVESQSNLLRLKKSNLLKYYNYTNSFNKANLNINLLTKMNLKDVEVLQQINNLPGQPYLNYNIDPKGELFGNTPCGANNFVSYMVYNPIPPPYTIPIPNPPEPLVPSI
jgi:hypothetical protein